MPEGFTDLGFARVDSDRARRCGFPEVIFGAGKTPADVLAIGREILAKERVLLVSRANEDQHRALAAEFPAAVWHARARCISVEIEPFPKSDGVIGVICAGTSDLPVAEEASIALEAAGVDVIRITDVGVAGVHRVLEHRAAFEAADAVIVVAGMEGALPSVVAGLTSTPIVAVPTSVGYGASFEGLTALLAMMTSCAPGVSVVNIDNGFGAAQVAFRTVRRRNDAFFLKASYLFRM